MPTKQNANLDFQGKAKITKLPEPTASDDAATKGSVGGELGSERTRAETAEGEKLGKASNLSDLGNASLARVNLGLGSAAMHANTDFDPAGAAATARATAEAASDPLGAAASERARAEAAEAGLIPDSRGSAAGDLLLFNGTSFVRLPHGEPGQLLSVRSDGTVGYVPAPSISVDAWTAKGNGENDTAVFQAASKFVSEAGGGTVRMSDKEYAIDGLIQESGVFWEGSSYKSSGGTRITAIAGSSKEGIVLINPGVVAKWGWKNAAFVPNAANTNQDIFYLHGQEPEGGGTGGVTSARLENCELGSAAHPIQRNGVWLRGGTANAKCPMQFIAYRNCTFVRANTGAQAKTSRCIKGTGQLEKVKFDTLCSLEGASASSQVGTHAEFSLEYMPATTTTVEAIAGASIITVASTAGLENNKKFLLGEGSTSEVCQVLSIAGSQVSLKTPLAFTHAGGENVYALAGTVGSPTPWAPHEIIFDPGVTFQNTDLCIVADSVDTFTCKYADIENASRFLKIRQSSYQVDAERLHIAKCSEGSSNGNGNVTAGSATITEATGTWAEGDLIAGPGLPLGATVTKVEGEAGHITLTLSAPVAANGVEGTQSVTLIKGGRGEGYIVYDEGNSTGIVSYYPTGAVDRTVVAKTSTGLRVRDLSRSQPLNTYSSSGLTLQLATAASLSVRAARQVVLTNNTTIVKTLSGWHATGEQVTLVAGVNGVKLEQGSNISLGGRATLTLEANDAATFTCVDAGTWRWVLTGLYRAKEPGVAELEWREVESVNAKLEATEGYPPHFQYAVSGGRLYLRGAMKAKEEITSGSTLFTIPSTEPSGRPASKRSFNGFNSEGKTAPITIASTGTLTINSAVKAAGLVGVGENSVPIAG